MSDTERQPTAIDTSKPHPARMYDWFLGGKDNYPVDWAAAEEVQKLFPQVPELARANREFMHRASRTLAELGIRQFLDIGTGIPTRPNLHQVVQAVAPECGVVYVDNDPIVLRHAQALLSSAPEGGTAYIQADAREPRKIVEAARELLDLTQPVALSMVALLHFVPDEDNAYDVVRELLDPLPAGSCLVLSHATADVDPDTWHAVVDVYRRGGTSVQVRSRAEFAKFFAGLDLLEPGIRFVTDWRPDTTGRQQGERLPLYAAVGRK
ncbi:SAM-dependent methyltransferase [Streptomyces sp. NPDC090119]|uniref:SAM-dependent methyltransferase n=1 Tax=Streptomyces sp. NPDC090119 TaxID=3365951 RepID=UPI0037F74460